MDMNRVLVSWSGSGVVGSAVNVLSFAAEGGDPDVGAIGLAYAELQPILPVGVAISVAGSGDTYDDATGTLVGSWTAAGAGSFNGEAAFNPAAGVGACVTWNTGLIVNGRRLRGRTFLVPLATSAYDADGTLTASALTALQSFATALLMTGPMGVWHRPTTPGGSDGAASGVVSYRLRDKVAILTSRRD